MSASKIEKSSIVINKNLTETRSFSAKDRASLQKIYLESRKSTFHWMDHSLFKTSDFELDTDGECILVATIENNPVGFISAWEPDNFIHHLFVHPSYIGKGAGSTLLHACLRNIGRPAKLKCLDKNIGAKDFYLSKGWEIVSQGEGPDGKYLLLQFD